MEEKVKGEERKERERKGEETEEGGDKAGEGEEEEGPAEPFVAVGEVEGVVLSRRHSPLHPHPLHHVQHAEQQLNHNEQQVLVPRGSFIVHGLWVYGFMGLWFMVGKGKPKQRETSVARTIITERLGCSLEQQRRGKEEQFMRIGCKGKGKGKKGLRGKGLRRIFLKKVKEGLEEGQAFFSVLFILFFKLREVKGEG